MGGERSKRSTPKPPPPTLYSTLLNTHPECKQRRFAPIVAPIICGCCLPYYRDLPCTIPGGLKVRNLNINFHNLFLLHNLPSSINNPIGPPKSMRWVNSGTGDYLLGLLLPVDMI